MGEIAVLGNTAWRDWVVEANPASGPHDPLKQEIRAFVDAVDASIGVFGTGDPETDTPLLQDAFDNGAGVVTNLVGTFVLRWLDDPLFHFADKTLYPAFVAVTLNVGNLHVRGPATIKYLPPAFVYETTARFMGFATPDHADANAIRKVLFEDITFDFWEEIGAPLPTWTQAVYVAGGTEIEFRNCRFTVSPQTAGVVITADGSNQAVVAWPDGHPAPDGRGMIQLDGPDLPPEILAGEELYIRSIDDDTHHVSAIDTGARRVITPGTYVTTAHGRHQSGRGLFLANVKAYQGANNLFEYVRQSYYTHFFTDFNMVAETHRYLTEAYDFDCEAEGGTLTDIITENLNGDAQPIDGSPIRNMVISGMRCKATRSAIFAYTKSWANGDYSFFRKHHLRHTDVVFGTGTPGTCTIPEAELVEGTRIWFESSSAAAPATFPTCTVSGGPLASSGGTIQWHTVFIRNPSGDACNLSETAAGALIDISAAGSGGIRGRIIPDPATVKPSSAVVINGLVVTDPIVEASDDDNYDDPDRDAIGKHIAYIGHAREQTPGLNRRQFLNGVPRQAENIQFVGCDFAGGNRISVGECDGFAMTSCKMRDQITGSTAVNGGAIILVRGIDDATSRAQGMIRARLRDVEIVNSAGMGIRGTMVDKLDIEGLTVRGFNSQAADNTCYGVHLTHMLWPKANVTLGRIDISGGLAGATLPVRQMRMTANGVNPDGAGSLRLRTPGPFRSWSSLGATVHVHCDVGANIVDRDQVLIAFDTTAATGVATQRLPIWSNRIADGQALYAAVTNSDSLAGGADFTTMRIRKIANNGGSGTLSDVSGSLSYDGAAVVAATTRDFVVGGTDSPDTLALATDTLVLEATRNGNGSKGIALINLVVLPYSSIE